MGYLEDRTTGVNGTFPNSGVLASRVAPVTKLVTSARRRGWLVAITEEMAWVALTALGALILTLLFGSDYVSLAFAVLVSAIALGIIAWRLRRHNLQSYSVAQIVDREFHLHDTISTAYFLALRGSDAFSPDISAWQLEQASALAETVDPRRAFPFRGSRRWAAAGAFFALAISLFAARFLVARTLSLHPPLISLPLDAIVTGAERALGTKEENPLEASGDPRRQSARPADNRAKPEENERAESIPPIPLQPKTGGSASQPGSSSGNPGELKQSGEQGSSDKGESADKTAQSGSRQATENAGSNQPGTTSNGASQTGSDGKPQAASASKELAGSNPGMMSRLKDALSSMMAKMNPQGGGQKTSASGDQSTDKAQGGQQASQSGEQSASQQSQNGAENAASEESTSGQGDGQTAEKSGGSQGHSSSNSQDKKDSSQSGVGRQDGDKQLRDAEQQQAMGKLAEILGKRSASLTGDMTVETPSGNQQLQTEYTHQQGRHIDSGGEINRNEVPPRYRQYVQDYMEQIRKTRK